MHFGKHFNGRGHGRRHGFRGGWGAFGGGRGGFRAARMLASGDLQLVILSLLQEKPRHGYEIIKALEEKSSGFYTPSPGVVYPALTYLEEAEFAISEMDGNKKRYQITDTGKEHLAKNKALSDEILQQLTLVGMKMAKMKKHFTEEEVEAEFADKSSRKGGEWANLKMEFRTLKHELRAALFEKIDATEEEKERILGILKNAIKEIRER